jgi:hypothetical protein
MRENPPPGYNPLLSALLSAVTAVGSGSLWAGCEELNMREDLKVYISQNSGLPVEVWPRTSPNYLL